MATLKTLGDDLMTFVPNTEGFGKKLTLPISLFRPLLVVKKIGLPSPPSVSEATWATDLSRPIATSIA